VRPASRADAVDIPREGHPVVRVAHPELQAVIHAAIVRRRAVSLTGGALVVPACLVGAGDPDEPGIGLRDRDARR
jgi:hypothetical protein